MGWKLKLKSPEHKSKEKGEWVSGVMDGDSNRESKRGEREMDDV